jgi:hypothetical protein
MQVSIPSAADPNAPKYWMNETSGLLAPVVEAYLYGDPLTAGQVAVMKMYLRQWIMSPVWQGDGLEELRRPVERIRTRQDINEWLAKALAEGHDPL